MDRDVALLMLTQMDNVNTMLQRIATGVSNTEENRNVSPDTRSIETISDEPETETIPNPEPEPEPETKTTTRKK